jgi:hypothetical protein
MLAKRLKTVCALLNVGCDDGVASAAQAGLRLGEPMVITGHPVRDPALIRDNYPAFQNDPDPKIVDTVQIRRTERHLELGTAPSATPPECSDR